MPIAIKPKQIILINDTEDDGVVHNKFWIIEHDEHLNVNTRWGRLGRDGQSKSLGQIHKGAPQWTINSVMEEPARKKRSKGYRSATKEEFALKTVVANSIGTNNQMKKCEYVIVRDENTFKRAYDGELTDPANDIGIYVEVFIKKEKFTHLLLFRSDGEVYPAQACRYRNVPLKTDAVLDKIKVAVGAILSSGVAGL